MRRISMNLWSTSAMAVALIAAPAAAQTTDPATPPDPTVEAQEQPADPEALAALLVPCPPEWLEAYPVSTLVNSPANEDPACIEPASAR